MHMYFYPKQVFCRTLWEVLARKHTDTHTQSPDALSHSRMQVLDTLLQNHLVSISYYDITKTLCLKGECDEALFGHFFAE